MKIREIRHLLRYEHSQDFPGGGLSWRKIALKRGMNPGTVYRVARSNYFPKSPELRSRLGYDYKRTPPISYRERVIAILDKHADCANADCLCHELNLITRR